MKQKHTYTITQLQEAVNNSKSFSQVFRILGLNSSGGAYLILKRNITNNKIDISHFTGRGWLKSTKGKRKSSIIIPLQEILEGLHPQYQTHKLRLRLIECGIFDHKCYQCLNVQWEGQPIPLQLEHKDGNCQNHILSNLTLLCPNCHALTETFAGKNKKLKKVVGMVGLEPTRELLDAF